MSDNNQRDDNARLQPTRWADYERGRGSPAGSVGSHVQWDELTREHSYASGFNSPPNRGDAGGYVHERAAPPMARRRSSMSMRINSIRQAGGPNSLDNFARSWQRAASFFEITPRRPSFRFSEAGEDEGDYGDEEDGYGAPPGGTQDGEPRSLLRAALEREGARQAGGESAVVEDGEQQQRPQAWAAAAAAQQPQQQQQPPHESTALLAPPIEQRLSEHRGSSWRDESIFQIEPSLASPFGGSYGTTYGSLSSRANKPSMRHAARLFREQQAQRPSAGGAEGEAGDKEREPILVKQVVEEDGKKVNVIVGQSTLPQTVFNSVNILIGIGILSLPLAFKYCGWLIGVAFFLFSAVATAYTAKLLGKCLDVDNSLITFSDLAYVSFGHKARIATSILFTAELVATCVALVILFADSLDALVPGLDVLTWKIICGVVLIPLAFFPLRLLSFTSVLGIVCCFAIVIAVVVDGVFKRGPPGSLVHPAKTWLFPEHWGTVPLAIGLLMAPWGGHSVLPNVYRDMRHPYKYRKAVDITFSFSYLIDFAMAVCGFIMFGDLLLDEVTSNILETKGYPKAVAYIIGVCIAIIPLTKVPLNARPIFTTLEVIFGLDHRALAQSSRMVGASKLTRGLLKAAIRVGVTVFVVLIAIVFPAFDRVMALLGSVACFAICIILPIAFHLKLFGSDIGRAEKALNWVLMVASIVMAVVSTVFACLPRKMIGARG